MCTDVREAIELSFILLNEDFFAADVGSQTTSALFEILSTPDLLILSHHHRSASKPR